MLGKPPKAVSVLPPSCFAEIVHVGLGAGKNSQSAVVLELPGEGKKILPAAQVRKSDQGSFRAEEIGEESFERRFVILPRDGDHDALMRGVLLNDGSRSLGTEKTVRLAPEIARQDDHSLPLGDHGKCSMPSMKALEKLREIA